jgi:hypothetical protein
MTYSVVVRARRPGPLRPDPDLILVYIPILVLHVPHLLDYHISSNTLPLSASVSI